MVQDPTSWFSLDRAGAFLMSPVGMGAVALAGLAAWRAHRNRRAKQQKR
ncbi:hypothetical protein [Streptomyces chattanoogensis]|nr:hypothetical protein [Streptomyces chattanoogensis]